MVHRVVNQAANTAQGGVGAFILAQCGDAYRKRSEGRRREEGRKEERKGKEMKEERIREEQQ